jgi:hypothetical protein
MMHVGSFTYRIFQGDYTLRAQLTSDKASLLEKQKTLTLALARTIPEIKLDAYATYNAAVAGGPAFGEKRVRKGVACPVFFAPPPADKVRLVVLLLDAKLLYWCLQGVDSVGWRLARRAP